MESTTKSKLVLTLDEEEAMILNGWFEQMIVHASLQNVGYEPNKVVQDISNKLDDFIDNLPR